MTQNCYSFDCLCLLWCLTLSNSEIYELLDRINIFKYIIINEMKYSTPFGMFCVCYKMKRQEIRFINFAHIIAMMKRFMIYQDFDDRVEKIDIVEARID